MLSAFNHEYATAPAGSSRAQQLRNAVFGLLSGLLNRNQTGIGTSGQTKPGWGSLTGLLRGLINTNSAASGSAAVNRTTLVEFQKLQAGLQPVVSLLQTLNIPPRQSYEPRSGAPRGGCPGAGRLLWDELRERQPPIETAGKVMPRHGDQRAGQSDLTSLQGGSGRPRQ